MSDSSPQDQQPQDIAEQGRRSSNSCNNNTYVLHFDEIAAEAPRLRALLIRLGFRVIGDADQIGTSRTPTVYLEVILDGQTFRTQAPDPSTALSIIVPLREYVRQLEHDASTAGDATLSRSARTRQRVQDDPRDSDTWATQAQLPCRARNDPYSRAAAQDDSRHRRRRRRHTHVSTPLRDPQRRARARARRATERRETRNHERWGPLAHMSRYFWTSVEEFGDEYAGTREMGDDVLESEDALANNNFSDGSFVELELHSDGNMGDDGESDDEFLYDNEMFERVQEVDASYEGALEYGDRLLGLSGGRECSWC